MKSLPPAVTPIQRMTEEEEEALQMKGKAPKGLNTTGLESRLQSQQGGGMPLEGATLQMMERGIGADFSGVRIHTGKESAQMNRQLRSRAFTHGQDIYFNQGEYQPHSNAGKHLLAHELTHVVQQGNEIRRKGETQKYSPAIFPSSGKM